MAQLDAPPTGDQEIVGSNPTGSATFFRGDCPLIQGQLSVSGERICTILVNHLEV